MADLIGLMAGSGELFFYANGGWVGNFRNQVTLGGRGVALLERPDGSKPHDIVSGNSQGAIYRWRWVATQGGRWEQLREAGVDAIPQVPAIGGLRDIRGLAVHPTVGLLVLLRGASGNAPGVYSWRPGESTWTERATGRPFTTSIGLACRASDGAVFTVSNLTNIENGDANPPAGYALIQFYIVPSRMGDSRVARTPAQVGGNVAIASDGSDLFYVTDTDATARNIYSWDGLTASLTAHLRTFTTVEAPLPTDRFDNLEDPLGGNIGGLFVYNYRCSVRWRWSEATSRLRVMGATFSM